RAAWAGVSHPCRRPARRSARPRAGGARRQDVRRLAPAAALAPDPRQGPDRRRAARPARLGRPAQPRDESGRQDRRQSGKQIRPPAQEGRRLMRTLVEIGLSNAMAATLLAIVAVTAGRLCRQRVVAHALWLLVLVKLVTPPLVRVPLSWPASVDERPKVEATVALADDTERVAPAPIDRSVLLAQLELLEQTPPEEQVAETTPLDLGTLLIVLWLPRSPASFPCTPLSPLPFPP